ncbi:MAG: site-2 protease family protein [Candidatus Atribacteria bacterium]|nr:MAG: site-2 protease family protein [Candidatus Atribacteria bacterium]
MNIDSVLNIALSLIAIFIAIVLHEVAHGYMALRLGDPTARSLGRLTLNPLAHIDPIGTILVPVILAVIGAPLFGWAKPVPINPRNFRNPFRGMLFVALAGPGTNVALALGATIVGHVLLLMVPESLNLAAPTFGSNLLVSLFTLLGYLVLFNLFLAALNMIPIPPLDGSRVLTYFLPTEGRRIMLSLERYGFFIFAGLLYLGVFDGAFRAMQGLWMNLLGNHWLFLMFA